MELTYGSYLKLDRLLALQEPRSEPEEHDELLFIVIHQVYELWFKLMLHEAEKVAVAFSAGDLFGAVATLRRMRTVMKTLVGQLDVLETMTLMSFSGFRDRLETASGFQSAQFREFEFLLGYKREDMLRYHEAGSPARSANPKNSSTSPAAASARASRARPAPNSVPASPPRALRWQPTSTFSSTVNSWNRVVAWKVRIRPSSAMALVFMPEMSRPS